MTEPNGAAKRKACKLANAEGEGALYTVAFEDPFTRYGLEYGYGAKNQALYALARHIQTTSDVAKEVQRETRRINGFVNDRLQSLILDDEPCQHRLLLVQTDRARCEKCGMTGTVKRDWGPVRDRVQSLILPDEPDPLQEELARVFIDQQMAGRITGEEARELREALARRGLKIVEADRDD